MLARHLHDHMQAKGTATLNSSVQQFLGHCRDSDLPSYMAQALFPKLVNAPYKRYIEIGEGTHTVIMERNRMQLFRGVQQFLDEPAP